MACNCIKGTETSSPDRISYKWVLLIALFVVFWYFVLKCKGPRGPHALL